MKKIFVSLTLIVAASIAIVGATRSVFSDTEQVLGNTFSAGTLDLKVDDTDGTIEKITFTNIAPGFDSQYRVFCLKNTGTVSGQPSIQFSQITNEENGVNAPEAIAELEPYASIEGELGQYLKYTIGIAPCNWSVPSNLISEWSTGPQHPWGIPGINNLSGETFFQGPTGSKFPVLGENEEYGFFIRRCLPMPYSGSYLC